MASDLRMPLLDTLPLSGDNETIILFNGDTNQTILTTAKPTILGHDSITKNENQNCERLELYYIKLALLSAILICLIVLICSICITSMCYLSAFNQAQNETERAKLLALSQIASNTNATQQQEFVQSAPNVPPTNLSDNINPNRSPINSPINQQLMVNRQQVRTTQPDFTSFRRLTISPEPQDRMNNLFQTPNTSTFSVNMAPPSARSVSTGPGMNSPEETMVKKFALDRMEQEEANRQMDLALMTDKSGASVMNIPSIKESSANRINVPPSDTISHSVTTTKTTTDSKHGSSKRRHKRNNSSKQKASTNVSDNPSFTLDKKTNKLVLGSSLKTQSPKNVASDKNSPR